MARVHVALHIPRGVGGAIPEGAPVGDTSMSPAPRCNIRVSAPVIGGESDAEEVDDSHVDDGEAALSRRKVKLMAQHAVKSAVKRAASAPRLERANGRDPARSGARGAHGRNVVTFARTPHAVPRTAF